MNTLKERYDSKQEIIAEAFMDYFKTGSENIQKFNVTLEKVKWLANTYKLQNLQKAISEAERQFEDIVMKQQTGQKPDKNKATAISRAVTFVSTMSNFLDTFKNITLMLPSMKDALSKVKDPEIGKKPMRDILGQDTNKFGQLITAQFNKSGGGIFKAIGRFFSGGGVQNPVNVMLSYGISGDALANDLLNLTPEQLLQFSQQSATVPAFQLNVSQTTTGTTPTQGTQGTKQTQPTETTSQTQRPNKEIATQRNTAIQRVVQNKNAFNLETLGTLSNEEILQDFQKIAKALNFKL